MPKARRFFIPGYHYHLTHRCHNRSFLLQRAIDRKVYREMLRQRLKDFRTPLLAYCITSNHVHLLVTAGTEDRISRFMESLEGDFAQYYNLRKKRSGAFWGGRFHATAIEDQSHLWQCMIYIELNMVRAGLVRHPAEWPWCSYAELMGERKRYRLVDRDHLATAFGHHPDTPAFKSAYRHGIEQVILARAFARQAKWTESLAIGSEAYVDHMSTLLTNRNRLDRYPEADRTDQWILKEGGPPEGA